MKKERVDKKGKEKAMMQYECKGKEATPQTPYQSFHHNTWTDLHPVILVLGSHCLGHNPAHRLSAAHDVCYLADHLTVLVHDVVHGEPHDVV